MNRIFRSSTFRLSPLQRMTKCAIAAIAVLFPGLVLAADAPLRPPHGELPPTFWEQYGWVVAIATLAALAVLIVLFLAIRRPKTVVVIPPDVLAKRMLEALRGQPENDTLLVKVSAILRRYVVFACGLPAMELTTAEVSRVVATNPTCAGPIADAVTALLQRCDERKFAPAPPPANLGAADTALALVEKIETRRLELAATRVNPPPIPSSVSATATP